MICVFVCYKYCIDINIDNNTNIHKLNWEPNDFTIPADVLVRAYERLDVKI